MLLVEKIVFYNRFCFDWSFSIFLSLVQEQSISKDFSFECERKGFWWGHTILFREVQFCFFDRILNFHLIQEFVSSYLGQCKLLTAYLPVLCTCSFYFNFRRIRSKSPILSSILFLGLLPKAAHIRLFLHTIVQTR